MIYLTTDTPQFFADIGEVLRLFYGDIEIGHGGDGGASGASRDGVLITHTHEEAGGLWRDTFALKRAGGPGAGMAEASDPVASGSQVAGPKAGGTTEGTLETRGSQAVGPETSSPMVSGPMVSALEARGPVTSGSLAANPETCVIQTYPPDLSIPEATVSVVSITLEAPISRVDALTDKRMMKRAVKTACYALMTRVHGIHPPWGSLTGVRPQKLLDELLEEGASPDEAMDVLTGRFDLSPDKARLLMDIRAAQQRMPEQTARDVDIYIGIPFCTTRCAYCTFSAGEAQNTKLIPEYLDALIHEIEECAKLLDELAEREGAFRMRAAYMGGGTPTALSASELDKLLGAARRAFPGGLEWTVEAGRPDTIDRDKLAALRAHGITRISVNPQTFHDSTLRRIGRAHTVEDTLRAFELARGMGFDHINMDLIAALPGEDEAMFAESLSRTLALRPESVTVHTLAVKRASRLRQEGYGRGGDAGGIGAGRDPVLGTGEMAAASSRGGVANANGRGAGLDGCGLAEANGRCAGLDECGLADVNGRGAGMDTGGMSAVSSRGAGLNAGGMTAANEAVEGPGMGGTAAMNGRNMDGGNHGSDARDAADRCGRMPAHAVAVPASAGTQADRLTPAVRMVDTARSALTAAGYQPYYLYRQKYMADNLENVGYALPGRACMYNVDIMQETTRTLAMGAGAITKWLFDEEPRIRRAPNIRDIRGYIGRVDEMIARKRGMLGGLMK